MNWEKKGMIFDPSQHEFFHGKGEFAQSPQTLVLPDRVRIYFSTRNRDDQGKYLSQIAYADFNKKLDKLIGISHHTVIPLGDLGCFDEHGIFPIHVFNDGKQIMAYTCGWQRRVSVPVETSIGLAISKDGGHTFSKIGNGPILSSSLHEPFLVGDGFVKKYGGTYHMWYIYGTHWLDLPEDNSPARVYKIGHATSQDGINWKKEGRQIISDRLDENECQALPTIIDFDGKYHMFFCYRHASGFRKNINKGYRIGYASSTDLITWERNDHEGGMNISSEGWDSEMQCYPHIFECEGKIFLLYNGNGFGKHGFGLAELIK